MGEGMVNEMVANKEIFSKNLKHYMAKRNKNATDICNDLKIKQNTFSDWYNAKTYPRIDKIEMLANYFNCSKSELVEGARIPQYNSEHIQLIDMYSRLTDSQQELVLSTMRAFLENKSQ